MASCFLEAVGPGAICPQQSCARHLEAKGQVDALKDHPNLRPIGCVFLRVPLSVPQTHPPQEVSGQKALVSNLSPP